MAVAAVVVCAHRVCIDRNGAALLWIRSAMFIPTETLASRALYLAICW